MNTFVGLQFGSAQYVAPQRLCTSRPTSFNQAKLVTIIAAILALSTTFADAAKRHVRKATHRVAHHVVAHHVKVVRLPIHVAPEPSYWMYRRCSPGARAADPYTVCFPSNAVRPYLGRDPDINVRFELRRDWTRNSKLKTASHPCSGLINRAWILPAISSRAIIALVASSRYFQHH
jgi:hypothetical protein